MLSDGYYHVLPRSAHWYLLPYIYSHPLPRPGPHPPIFFLPVPWPVSQAISHCLDIVHILSSGLFSFHTKRKDEMHHLKLCLYTGGLPPCFFKATPEEAVVQLSFSVHTCVESWPICNPNSGFFFLLWLVGQESLLGVSWRRGTGTTVAGAVQLACSSWSCPCSALAVPFLPYNEPMLGLLDLKTWKVWQDPVRNGQFWQFCKPRRCLPCFVGGSRILCCREHGLASEARGLTVYPTGAYHQPHKAPFPPLKPSAPWRRLGHMAQVTELLAYRVTQGHLQTLEWGPRGGASLSFSGEALQAKRVKFLEKEKENEVALCRPIVCCFGYFYVYISQRAVASCRADVGSQLLYLYSPAILGKPPHFSEPQCPPL